MMNEREQVPNMDWVLSNLREALSATVNNGPHPAAVEQMRQLNAAIERGDEVDVAVERQRIEQRYGVHLVHDLADDLETGRADAAESPLWQLDEDRYTALEDLQRYIEVTDPELGRRIAEWDGEEAEHLQYGYGEEPRVSTLTPAERDPVESAAAEVADAEGRVAEERVAEQAYREEQSSWWVRTREALQARGRDCLRET